MNINVAFQNQKPLAKGVYTIEVAARNAYRLFANTTCIHNGPSRSAHGFLQVDTMEIHLLNEANYVTIEVVGNNINSYCCADEPPLFAARIHQDHHPLLETEDFQCFFLTDRTMKVQRYSFQRCFAESYVQSHDRSAFYLGDKTLFPPLEVEPVKSPKLLPRQTPYPRLETIEFKQPIESGTFYRDASKPVWRDRAIDNISDIFKGYSRESLDVNLTDDVSRFVYRKQTKAIQDKTLNANTYAVYDAQRTLTGFTQCDIEVLESAVLHLVFDEVDYQEKEVKNTDGIHIDFSRNDSTNVIRYDLQVGKYRLLSFEPYSLRYLNVLVEKGIVKINTIGFVKFENHHMYRLHVETEDEEINQIVKAAQHTLAQNAVDILMDCPSRERAGWLCDAYFSAKAERLMSGDSTIERNFLLNYANAPQSPHLPEGMIPMNYPSDPTDGIYIANWSLWYGIELYEYYQRTNDQALIDQSWPNIAGLISYFKQYENELGLLEDLQSWVFIEWSQANEFVAGVNTPSNMIYAYFLERMGSLYNQDALIDQAKQIKATLQAVAFEGRFFVDQLIRDDNHNLVKTANMSETCQYYAFFTHTATPKTHTALFDVLMKDFGFHRDARSVYPNVHKSNAFIGNYLRLEVLRRERRYVQILKECKSYFLYMAQRTGTLWEHSAVFGSLNHGFASFAANLLVEALSGIQSIDQDKKIIYYQKSSSKLDFEMRLPFEGGIRVYQKNHVLKWSLPDGYRVFDCS